MDKRQITYCYQLFIQDLLMSSSNSLFLCLVVKLSNFTDKTSFFPGIFFEFRSLGYNSFTHVSVSSDNSLPVPVRAVMVYYFVLFSVTLFFFHSASCTFISAFCDFRKWYSKLPFFDHLP